MNTPTPLEQFYNYLEQNQYYIGDDLLEIYSNLLLEESKNYLDIYNKGFSEGKLHNQLK